MRKKRILLAVVACVGLGLAWVSGSTRVGVAEEKATYVGPDACKKCHSKVVKEWEFTAHRKLLFNEKDSDKGCEACHGPGSLHIEGGGDTDKIIRPSALKPDQSAAVCLKCHTQEHVTLWPSSLHARAKLSCTNCHDSHSPSTHNLSKDLENGKIELEGLSRAIKEAELAAAGPAQGSDEQTKALAKVAELKAERNALLKEVKGAETAYNRSAEPQMCYSCHKAQQVQSKLPSHHPLNEGKVKCSDCHNPHGGPNGMLREESVVQTCYRCHAEKEGPFVYDHPPVSEDCTICHSPHGSVQNNLLVQSQPFLCLKCHAGPHGGASNLGTAAAFANRYTACAHCHTQPHGSDKRAGLTY